MSASATTNSRSAAARPNSSTSANPARATVALVGNPNTGKTTLFNALTGFRRHVANYPGVTVDVAHGPIAASRGRLELLDLPGTYSLAAMAPDESIVVDVISGRVPGGAVPDAILAIVDASNLSRNLYLLSQLLELGRPIVVALNMIDVAQRRGLKIDTAELSKRLGVTVVPVVATRSRTLGPLVEALNRVVESEAPTVRVDLPAALAREAEWLRQQCGSEIALGEAVRLLLDPKRDDDAHLAARGLERSQVDEARGRLAATGQDIGAAEVRARYAWISRILDGVVRRPDKPVVTFSDRLDWVLTHRFLGGLVLFAVLFLVFQAIFTWARPLMDSIDQFFASFASLAGGWLASASAPDAVQSLVTDGIIKGVGSVIVFLPQILILFAFIAILEDCGYLARAAYMVDRLMRLVGLSGRSFIPLLSSFACAVPAIMGTRSIADRRERFITIMIAPFMSCSARLPVYVLMISVFVPATHVLGTWVGLQGVVMLAAYLVGVVVAIPLAWLLKRTSGPGQGLGLLLEMPSYKLPRLSTVLQRMYFAGRGFLVRAGTIILLVNCIVWALCYFPHRDVVRAETLQQSAASGWDAQRFGVELDGAYLRDSYLARMGRAIEPAVRPLGWDWRIGMAVLASFPAREVVISSLGTIFNLGGDVDSASQPLREALRTATREWDSRPLFDLPVALSLIVFFALCAQCASTLVIMGRELRSWAWPALSFFGMTTIAYVAALGTGALARLVMSSFS